MWAYWFFYDHILSEPCGLEGVGSETLGMVIVLKLLFLLSYDKIRAQNIL
jgi:hypothetical protein